MSDERYKIKHFTELDSSFSTQNLPESGTAKFLFQIQASSYKLVVNATSSADRISWLRDVKTCIEKLNKKARVFGAPLEELLKREGRSSGIPFAVETLVDHLRKINAVQLQGLLRVSGNQTAMEQLRDTFDNGIIDVADLELGNYGPHDAAGVLKMYFLDLPEPLLTYDLYDRFLFVLKKPNIDDDQKVSTIRSIIRGGVPKANLPLIKFMMYFFAEVVKNSDLNKITSKNIGILVAYHYIAPREQTLESRHDLPFLHQLIEILIEHRDVLFCTDDSLLPRTRFFRESKVFDQAQIKAAIEAQEVLEQQSQQDAHQAPSPQPPDSSTQQ